MTDVTIGKGNLEGKGIFANRNFKKVEVVIKYMLKPLTEKEYESLPQKERNYCHVHWSQIYLYSSPERYVNHSENPNTLPDHKNKCDVAIMDIRKGEEITTDHTKDDID